MSKKNVPMLRFDGFSDDWEQRKLSEGALKIGDGLHGTPCYSQNGNVHFINGNNLVNGRIEITEETKRVNEIEQSSDDKILNENTILMSINGTIGNLAWYNGEQVMLGKSAAYLILSKFEKKFIYYYLQTQSVKNYFMNNLTGTTIKNLGLKVIRDTKLSLPNYDEQELVGHFFIQLDETLALHQRKLEQLKRLKQGFLQVLFANEATVPKLRFAGFTEEWEQRRFFDNIKNTIDFRGRTPKKLGMDWSHSGYLALSALNVKNGYIDLFADAHYGDQKLYDKWMIGNELYEGQVLFTTEAPMGNVAQVPDNNKYILSQRTIAFEVYSEKITNDFLAVLLSSPKSYNELSSLSSGGTARGVSQKSLSHFKVVLPAKLEEQQKIGTFFQQLDSTITLHQNKLAQLKKLKKSFLQSMFI